MENKEAIEAITANWPPENCTMLREALTVAINSLNADDMRKHGNPDLPPHYSVADIAHTLDHAVKHMSSALNEAEAHIESVIIKLGAGGYCAPVLVAGAAPNLKDGERVTRQLTAQDQNTSGRV